MHGCCHDQPERTIHDGMGSKRVTHDTWQVICWGLLELMESRYPVAGLAGNSKHFPKPWSLSQATRPVSTVAAEREIIYSTTPSSAASATNLCITSEDQLHASGAPHAALQESIQQFAMFAGATDCQNSKESRVGCQYTATKRQHKHGEGGH